MQQELDDFAKMIYNEDLTKEEQDLINELTAKASSGANIEPLEKVKDEGKERKMELGEL